MYPSRTVHFTSAWNPKADRYDHDDDLSSLSSSTTSTMIRSKSFSHQQPLKKLRVNAKRVGRKSLNTYMNDDSVANYYDAKRIVQTRRDLRPFDAVEAQGRVLVDDVPFDETVTQAKISVDRVSMQVSNDHGMNTTKVGNGSDDDGNDDDSSAGSYCNYQWEIQADGNVEPVMSPNPPPPPPRRNRFEKSRQSAFDSTRRTTCKTISSDHGENTDASTHTSRIYRRNRLEKMKQRQGGKLISTSRYLNKPTQPNAKSSSNTNVSGSTSGTIPTKKQPISEPDSKPPHEDATTSSTTSDNNNNNMTGADLDDNDNKEDFESNLSKLKLKLDAAKSLLGTQSDILGEVSRKYKTDTLSERGRQRIMNKTRFLQRSLPPLASQVSPTCNSVKTVPKNLNSFQSLPSKAIPSPGSSFTNSTGTTECTTSTTSSSKNSGYVMITESIQLPPSPKTNLPYEHHGEGVLSPKQQGLSYDEQLSSPPGLVRRRRTFPPVDGMVDRSRGSRSEDKDKLPFVTMCSYDEDEITITGRRPQTTSLLEEISERIFEPESDSESNEGVHCPKAHKVKLTVEVSGDSLEVLQQIIGKIEHDIYKYHHVEESINIATTCDHDFKSVEREVQRIIKRLF